MDYLHVVCQQRARTRSEADLLATPMRRECLGGQGGRGRLRKQGAAGTLTVDEAVFLGQEGRLQTFPTAQGPAEQHPWGERGIRSMVGLDIGQSWKEKM